MLSFIVSFLCHVLVMRRGNTMLHLTLLPTATFLLRFTLTQRRRNPTYSTILDPTNDITLRRTYFNTEHPTIIHVHGYGDSNVGQGSIEIRNAYLRRGHYNVILVNWCKLATLPWYITAVKNTRLVGAYLAFMIKWLHTRKAVPLSKIHVIGFSLGAEIAGFMGKALVPRKVARITGLDPAYPLYMNVGREGHLAWTDATFVDVIHTDGGQFGFPHPLGHADFFPNGGRKRQPGCDFRSITRMRFKPLISQYITCGHDRAWRYYAESIGNPYGFPASKCPRWRPHIQANCIWKPEGHMGFIAHQSKHRGKFYLRTNSRAPYATNLTVYKKKWKIGK